MSKVDIELQQKNLQQGKKEEDCNSYKKDTR